jgi:hypothetical protein
MKLFYMFYMGLWLNINVIPEYIDELYSFYRRGAEYFYETTSLCSLRLCGWT